MPIALLCWNVAGRVRRLSEQAQRVASVTPDVVGLQEVAPSTRGPWAEALARIGLEHVAVADTDSALAQGRRRPLATLTAARQALEPILVDGVPWRERVLSTRLGDLEILNVHSPISPSPELAKVLTHEAVHAHASAGAVRRIICGDFNTPRKEHADGRVWTFARTQYGKLRPDRGPRWDAAELALIKGLEPHGYRDAFRELYGPEVPELSWEWPRWGGGYRLDHLIVSPGVRALEVQYLHEWRREGLSDHSALFAVIE